MPKIIEDIYTELKDNGLLKTIDKIRKEWGKYDIRKEQIMTKIEIVSSDCGDWEALYINDKLVAEGHTIRVGDALHAIQKVFPHTFEYSFITDERAEEGFPEDRNELVDYIVD